MRTPVVLVTGAGGEVGHGLVGRLAGAGHAVITIDVAPLGAEVSCHVRRAFTGSVTDRSLLERILAEFDVRFVFHLAALLSTRAEFTPVAAHEVNVEGTLGLLEFAQHQGASHGEAVTVVYPSSIAVYGLPDLETKTAAGAVAEDAWNVPITMYGCNKLYCELLGRYYAKHYKQLTTDVIRRVDFRCVRFPGVISAATRPSGGTSDYAPEMVHAAARGEPYDCFVRPDTRIPFITMPDAIDALLALAAAPRDRLSRTAYNVRAFSPTAEELAALTVDAFPRAVVRWAADPKRQRIVDSWPADVNDDAARHDWGFSPRYDVRAAFAEYLVPGIRELYRT
ncbi:MAG: NAD-dependent epimerase/dehydratase family protein [Acidobacteria bacterium]|nr:NAD-dependent epimerase/dehydratase family protein [Acidobacteriota bacterium]